MQPRDYTRYTMRTGNRIQKYGFTTRDLEVREAENRNRGVPGKARKEGPTVTRETALAWERRKIENYRKRNGRRPPYNKV